MTDNPYLPPAIDSIREFKSVQFREFRMKMFSFSLTRTDYRNLVREQAQQAISQEIGAQNVISISEQIEALGGFCVTVWYRAS